MVPDVVPVTTESSVLDVCHCIWYLQERYQGNMGIGHALEYSGWQRIFGEPWKTEIPDPAVLCPKAWPAEGVCLGRIYYPGTNTWSANLN
jgi:hypothetical protein